MNWDEDDQDKALAWQYNENITCSGCGTKEDDWADDHMRYAPVITRCRGCEVRALGRNEIPEGGEGYQVMLVLNKPEEELDDE